MAKRPPQRARPDDDEPDEGDAPEMGHNRAELEATLAGELRALWDERDEINASMAAVRKRAKDGGINATVLTAAVKRQREDEKDSEARMSFEAELADMLGRLGEFQHTPLGKAAVERRAPN